MAVTKTIGTGTSGAIAVTHTVPSGITQRLMSVSVNFNTAPAASENLTITLDANAGATYDTVLYSLDLSKGSTSDVFWWPDGRTVLQAGDKVAVAFANSDGRTYGVQITTMEV